MATKITYTKKGKSLGGADVNIKREVNHMSRHDKQVELARINAGDPTTQQIRAKESGKTRRAAAYSGAAAASATSIGGNDQTVVYEQLATGGVGTTGENKGVDDASGVTITQ